MSLVIPDEVLRASNLTEAELGAEVALLLYKEERLSLAQAARLAGMSRPAFQHFLASREEFLNLDASDVAEDVESLRSLGLL